VISWLPFEVAAPIVTERLRTASDAHCHGALVETRVTRPFEQVERSPIG
jgi:hypothetical protein